MTHDAKHARARATGQTSEDLHPSPPLLQVITGQFDDPRAQLGPEHPLHGVALRAWREQDGWTAHEHELFWAALLPSWPRSKAPTSDRGERAWVAHVLHDGHGMPIGAIAESFHYELDTVQRLLRDGRKRARLHGRQRVRVPRAFAPGMEDSPEPPYVTPFTVRPTFFDFDHPEPRAFGWTDEDDAEVIVLPACGGEWERLPDD